MSDLAFFLQPQPECRILCSNFTRQGNFFHACFDESQGAQTQVKTDGVWENLKFEGLAQQSYMSQLYPYTCVGSSLPSNWSLQEDTKGPNPASPNKIYTIYRTVLNGNPELVSVAIYPNGERSFFASEVQITDELPDSPIQLENCVHQHCLNVAEVNYDCFGLFRLEGNSLTPCLRDKSLASFNISSHNLLTHRGPKVVLDPTIFGLHAGVAGEFLLRDVQGEPDIRYIIYVISPLSHYFVSYDPQNQSWAVFSPNCWNNTLIECQGLTSFVATSAPPPQVHLPQPPAQNPKPGFLTIIAINILNFFSSIWSFFARCWES